MMLRSNLLWITLLISLPALAQRPKDAVTSQYGGCGAPNGAGPNSTNYYGGGANPCAFTYSLPADRLIQLLNDVNYCTMYSRTQVNCPREIKGNYGQIRLDRRDGAGAGGGRTPGSAPELSYGNEPASPSTPAQRAEAERLWQRSVTLIDNNQQREAIPLLLQAGRLGHAKAQSTLGIAYQDGNGVTRNDAAAAHWFALAAAQGHRAAQDALAGMYEEGEGGLPKDPARARQLYLLSANQGFDKAQLEVGLAYEVGDGVPRSRQRAIQMLRASGRGTAIANILASPQTPARFASLTELGRYLKKLADIENARLAARIAKTIPQNSLSGNPIDRINAARDYAAWERKSGLTGLISAMTACLFSKVCCPESARGPPVCRAKTLLGAFSAAKVFAVVKPLIAAVPARGPSLMVAD